MDEFVMPIGQYRGEPVKAVPTRYLAWLVTQARGGLRRALAAELRRRGVEIPTPEPAPEPVCGGCGGARMNYRWYRDTVGRQHVKRFCAGCGRSLGFAPTDVYAAQANAAEARAEGK
jgi:hypothetical protein